MRNFDFVRNDLGTLLITGYPIYSVKNDLRVFMYHTQPMYQAISLPRSNSLTLGSTLPRCTVTVHMSFSLPRGNFERRVTRCPTAGNPPCRGNFSPCEQNAKVAPGQEQSCACSFLMLGINFPINSSRKHQK